MKYLYLPLEIVIREHDGKVALAAVAAAQGGTVLMGPKLSLYALKDQLPEGIFLIKSATPLEAGQIASLRAAGHKICSLDEEGVVTFREFLRENVRFGPETVSLIDEIFFWGTAQKQVFEETYPADAHKATLTGSPRLEFWRDHAAAIYAGDVARLRKQYGRFVLVPSSFGIGNNVLGKDQGLKLTRKHSGTISDTLLHFMTGQAEQNLIAFREYYDAMPDLVRQFPDTNFVIRPHPSESHVEWNALAAQFPNVHVAYEGAVTPWILAAAAIFHFKSTTSLEAHLMGVPAITYMPPLPPYMKKYELEIPLAVSIVCQSRDELAARIKSVIENPPQPKRGTIDGVLREWISTEERASAERILERLARHAPASMREFGAPKPVPPRDKLRALLHAAIPVVARLPFWPAAIRTRLTRRAQALAYGRRKYAGLSLDHTRAVTAVVGRSRGVVPAVREYAPDIFAIEKA